MISVRHCLRDKNAKRKSTIRTSVTYNGNRILFCPGYSISPDNWDDKRGLPRPIKGSVDVKTTTTNLKELDLKINRLYDDLSVNGRQVVPADIFKQKILALVHPNKFGEEVANQITLLDFFDLTIRDTERGMRLKDDEYRIEESSIKPYRTSRLHLAGYQKMIGKTILLSDFNQDLHDRFSSYLVETLKVKRNGVEKNLSKNTHAKYIMALYQVIKYAVKKKLLPAGILSDVSFKTTRENTDAIFLDESEILLLSNLNDIKSKTEEHVRDLFVLGCYTGLRFSDYSNLNAEYIDDFIINAIQNKTKNKVIIPIHPCVQAILDKYSGKLPVSPTNQEFNRTLKDLCKRIPEFHTPFTKLITRNRKVMEEEKMKWEMVMTHTARRSFCTNMYLLGVPILSIMAMSGHRSEKSFLRYIKAESLQHANIVRRFWDKKI